MTNQNQYRNDDFDFEAVFGSLLQVEIYLMVPLHFAYLVVTANLRIKFTIQN